MKLLLACFLIVVVIVFFKLIRRSIGKKTAPDSIQAITQLPKEGNIQAQYELAGYVVIKSLKIIERQCIGI
mgnify:CR=1 FL=1